MTQFKTTRGGGGGRTSAVASVFFMFLTRELTRPRFQTFLGVTFLIVLLLRQQHGSAEVGLAHDTSATGIITATTASTVPINTADMINNNNKPTTVMTSTTLSLTESKTNTRWYNRNNSTTTIPRTIYIFWSSGWPSERVEGQLVRRSWEYFNSGDGYTVHCLDFHQAEILTDRRRYIPDTVFDKLKVQARSDVYRTLILYRYGGIWVDASLFCNMPLDNWLNLNQNDLISFVRHDKSDKQQYLDIHPWITSWFLAAPKESYILSRIVQILSNTTEQERRLVNTKKKDYFWWHRIVSDLARQDDYIMNRIQTRFASADPMHCKHPGYETMAPVLKRCANNKMYSTFATAHVCCSGHTNKNAVGSGSGSSRRGIIKMAQVTANLTQKPMTATAWNNFCASWNCTMHSRNMHRIDDFKALFGNETFGKLPFLLYSD